jgi:ATP phosphoribosyltransferase regulatory subunit HisZ
MSRNENAQGHRYQQRVNKYKAAHIAAGGDGWADRLKAECLARKAETDAIKAAADKEAAEKEAAELVAKAEVAKAAYDKAAAEAASIQEKLSHPNVTVTINGVTGTLAQAADMIVDTLTGKTGA